MSPKCFYKNLSLQNLPGEKWKPVYLPNYASLYEVSNLGRVKSCDHYVTYHYKSGRCKDRLCKGRILRQEFNGRNRHGKTGHGYLFVRLYPGCHYVYVHQLVLRTFRPRMPMPNIIQINHNDEVKTDNRLSNLDYMTPRENANFGMRNLKVALPQQKPIVLISLDYQVYCPSLTQGAKFLCNHTNCFNYKYIRSDIWNVLSPLHKDEHSLKGFHISYVRSDYI